MKLNNHNADLFLFSLASANADLGRVNSGMLCEQVLSCVSFTAFVALESLLPRVRHYVLLQMTRLSASIVALVTLEMLFSCVLRNNVNFQHLSRLYAIISFFVSCLTYFGYMKSDFTL